MIGNTRESIWAMLVAAMPFAASQSTQHEPAVVTGKAVADAQIEYDNDGRTLLYCRLRRPTGNAGVDQAVCDLVERCVAGGAVSRNDTAACIKPLIGRLAAYVDAGLLQQLPPVQEDPVDPSDEITVTGKRPSAPQPGLWVFTEAGSRRQTALGLSQPLEKMALLDRTERLPNRTWRMCVKEDELTETLAAMLRTEPNAQKGSPCEWTIQSKAGRFEGTQRCAIPGALVKGTLVGEQDDSDFVAYKERNIRGLTALAHVRRNWDPSMLSPREAGAQPDPFAARTWDRIPDMGPGDEFRETSEVTGHRAATC